MEKVMEGTESLRAGTGTAKTAHNMLLVTELPMLSYDELSYLSKTTLRLLLPIFLLIWISLRDDAIRQGSNDLKSLCAVVNRVVGS